MRISDWSSDVCSSDLLITVWFGATLTDPDAKAETRQFFVRDGGAFQREDGFLHFLEDFIGWDMPVVRKYDSPRSEEHTSELQSLMRISYAVFCLKKKKTKKPEK